ncbi:MAG: type II secretion system protein GspC [Deltaproteobacteria bacterium]|nr:type II secretion system protein GspC [Deltaproteobacteria bacterium]
MTQKTYQILLNLLFLSAAIYLGVDTFYRVLAGRMNQETVVTLAEPSRSPPMKGHSPVRVMLGDFQIITKRNIFGSTNTPQGEKEPQRENVKTVEIESLEPTSLDIELLGTVSDLNGDGWAVIEDNKGKKQGLYRVGDPVKNAKIIAIFRGKVVLREDGKDQILEMEEMEPPEGGGTPSSTDSGTHGDVITVGRSDITTSLGNINKLLTQVRIRPHVRNGKPDGFILSYISSDSIFSKLGLQRGDVIKRLNGQPIKTPEDAFSFYKALESGSTLSLDILRKGKEKTIEYNIR